MAINAPGSNSNKNDNVEDAQINREDSRRDRRDDRRDDRSDREEAPRSFSPFGSLGQGGLMGRRINKNVGSENFTKLLENAKKILKDDGQTNVFRLIPLAREQHGTYYSAIIVVRGTEERLSENYGPHTHLTAQALLISATNSEPRAILDDSDRNNPIQVTRTSEDVYNDMFIGHVRRLTQGAYPGHTGDINLIDPIVVPRDFDAENEGTVRGLIEAVTTGLETRALSRHDQFEDWNLVEWLDGARDVRLPVTIESMAGENLTTILGQPLHADLAVSVSVEHTKRDRRDELNNSDNNEPICVTMGYTELVPVNPRDLEDSMPRSGRRGGRDFVPEAAWMARFNITNIEQSVTRTNAGLLLPIAAAAELDKDRRWAAPMKPQRGRRDEMFMNDPGALNIEANLQNDDVNFAQPIDTSEAAFDDRALGILLDRTVMQRMAIGIHCADTGPQAYYTSPFYALARGNAKARAKAKSDILRAADALTNNNFSNHFDDRDDIVDGEGERFHMGYWRDNNQRIRDIRELANYLPVANMMHAMRSDMTKLQDWNETFYGSAPESERMADRLLLANALSGETLVVTGVGLCVTAAGKFIDALVRGIEDTNAPLVSRTTNGVNLSSRRSVSRYSGSTLSSSSGFSRSYDDSRRSRSSRRERYYD